MYVKVSVSAGAKKESLEVGKGGVLLVSVREPAKQNLANKRVLELIARHFHVPTKECAILTGHRSPRKVISITT